MNFFESNVNVLRSELVSPLDFFPQTLAETKRLSEGMWERLAALALLVAVSPVLAFCAVLVKLSSAGPALYAQRRVGRGGKAFFIYKFRSMIVEAEAKTGPVLSQQFDPRVTAVGRFLRNTHLDELPQLFNVIKGEMSFIGPRPERPELSAVITQDLPRFPLRTAVKPGITGLAQVCGSYDLAPDAKLEFDLMYVQHKSSLKLNLFILYNTVRKILFVRFNQ